MALNLNFFRKPSRLRYDIEKNSISSEVLGKIRLKQYSKLCMPINIIYDCGSRDALDGIAISKLLNAKELHIFECNPHSFEVCKKNTKSLKKIKVFLNSEALYKTSKKINFYPINIKNTISNHPGKNPGASSLLRVNNKYKKEIYIQDHIMVDAISLNDYCKNNLPPDLLWVDLQGSELDFLKGSINILPNVKLIHIEVAFRRMYFNQTLFGEINKFLLANNFKLLEIDTSRWPKFLKIYEKLKFGPWVANAIYGNLTYFD